MTRLTLDTCVIVPTVLRQMIFLAADLGCFEVVISTRVIGEWERVGGHKNPLDRLEAQSAIAQLRHKNPNWIREVPQDQQQFWLPDPNDIHVLAMAVKSHCDGIMTHNTKDFPKDILAEYGLTRINPDQFLCSVLTKSGPAFSESAMEIISKVSQTQAPEKTFARAWLPQLGRKLTKRLN